MQFGDRYMLTPNGVTSKYVYKFVDSMKDEYKPMIEDIIAESVRERLKRNIEDLKERQKEINNISENYGLEVK